jgi:hypothetical protein
LKPSLGYIFRGGKGGREREREREQKEEINSYHL